MGNKYGLLGRTLGHSWSPRIHSLLGSYEYRLYPVEPDALGRFLAETDLDGMNVTIPYKKDVLPYCTALSDAARQIGSVNTLVRRPDGWYGDNTDYDGFLYMAKSTGVPIAGRKTLVFGTGGASLAVRAALKTLGADPIVSISRSGPDNYGNLARHRDAEILVNTTPLGMFPDTGRAAVSVRDFPACRCVLDIVYNPLRTALLLEAEALGIPCRSGLGMLVAQARKSAALFGIPGAGDADVEGIVSVLAREMENIILIGMPGCGKSTVGRALAEALGRPFLDADDEIVARAGMSIPDIFRAEGEDGFRRRETETLSLVGKGSGAIIATGGGCVTRPENYPLLHQNGRIFWLRRALEKLPSDGRPLSQLHSAQALYASRREQYQAFADAVIENDGPLPDTLRQIMEVLSK